MKRKNGQRFGDKQEIRNKLIICKNEKEKEAKKNPNMTCDKASFVQLDQTKSVHSLKNLIYM